MSDLATVFHMKLLVLAAQNQAKRVWSAVRTRLAALPIVFVSLNSAAYRALVSDGGPAGRNCDGALMTHGVMYANCGPAPGANAGGVGRHIPTAVPPTKAGGAGVKPSVLRHAMMALATVSPHAAPAAMAPGD